VIEEGGGLYYAPTILTGVTPDMIGFREEIFGLVLTVQTFGTETEGIAAADHPVYGLTASIFTSDLNRALRVAKVLKAGNVWVNRWGRTADMMTSPFGGFGGPVLAKRQGGRGLRISPAKRRFGSTLALKR